MNEKGVDKNSHGLNIEHFRAALEWRIFLLRTRITQFRQKRQKMSAEKILSDPRPARNYDSELIFGVLQDECIPPERYGYDLHSSWHRATSRVTSILNYAELQTPGKRVLDIGTGDGLMGLLLSDYGHEVTLCDIEDWRNEQAKQLLFLECDFCQTTSLEESSYDVIYSYNTFEHLTNPLSAFREIHRLCQPQGLIILSFGPLYCSPWGLHAYTALNMPYPQFLFSTSFISDKIDQLGVFDLGKKSNSLQPLNMWRVNQFEGLWQNSSFEIIDEHKGEDWSHLDFVRSYSFAFRGRELSFRDLVTQSIYVVLRKLN